MSLFDPLETRVNMALAFRDVARAALDRWCEGEVRDALLADIDHHLRQHGLTPERVEAARVYLAGADLITLFRTAETARLRAAKMVTRHEEQEAAA